MSRSVASVLDPCSPGDRRVERILPPGSTRLTIGQLVDAVPGHGGDENTRAGAAWTLSNGASW
jgi:hypothetical protein